jgi:ribosome-binding protein aMBF1 (putative translation factor)
MAQHEDRGRREARTSAIATDQDRERDEASGVALSRKPLVRNAGRGSQDSSTVFVRAKRWRQKDARMPLTPAQSRAARGLLDWSQTELATHSDLSESTVRDCAKGRRVPGKTNLKAIRAALEAAGVAFIDGDEPGVKRKRRPA